MDAFSKASFIVSKEGGRALHLGSSHDHLLQHYASKSDSGKYGQLNVDTNRLYLPGDEINASISINGATLQDLDSFEVDFKCEIHTFGWVQSGAPVGQSRQRRLKQEKQVLFMSTAVVQLPSMQTQSTSGIMSVKQYSPDEPLLATAVSRLPTFIAQSRNHSVQMPLPPVFHDLNRNSPASYVTYHWKLTLHRKGLLKSDERLWKPIMVTSLAQSPNNDIRLARLLTYPPNPMMNVRGMYKEVKKYMVKTAALMEVELALPSLSNYPIFRPAPVIVRLSVRAKRPSDLLDTSQFALPSLPEPPSSSSGSLIGPQFFIRRYRRSQVYGAPIEELRDRSVCVCRWDSGHLDNGFRQQADGKGFERGREGSTPLADERARSGQSHGWTWPARSDYNHDPAFFSTPTAPFRRGSLSRDLLHGSTSVPTKDSLKSFQYVTTCTLFASVYLSAHPNVYVNNLSVFNELHFSWPMDGLRNDMDARISSVDVQLDLSAAQAISFDQDELKNAICRPEQLSEQSLLFQGPVFDPSIPPPPLPPHHPFNEKEEQLPSYPGPSRRA